MGNSWVGGVFRRFVYIHFLNFLYTVFYRSRGAKIGKFCKLFGRLDMTSPRYITLGNYVGMAPGSRIIVHGPDGKPKPVIVEDSAYMGINALILPGVKVGFGAICGAGAVVTRDVPSMAIVAGNPARIIGQRSEEDRIRHSTNLAKAQPGYS